MSYSVKNLLKELLPLALLRHIQLQVNKVRVQTIDKIRFPEEPFEQTDFVVRRDEYPFRLYPIVTNHLSPRLRQQFEEKNYDWTQDEYLLIYNEPCLIEPRYGWALSTQNRLIYPSLGFSRAPYLHKPAARSKTLHQANLDEYSELVSLRDTGEENYYHFYNDVLVKLFFLEEKIGLSQNVPLLISRKLYDRPFFQYFRQHPFLRDRQWIVQGEEQYIRSRRTYFCKPLTHTLHYYSRILDMVRLEDLHPGGPKDRRLFITRSTKRQRFIENNDEIAAVCQGMGFDVIDFDEMSLPQQIQAMSQARYVIGIHGAGLVNMLFRGKKSMSVLEIYPPSTYFPFHYVLMANQLNYQYDGLIGLPGKHRFSGSFYVDPTELQQRLKEMLKQ